MRVADDTPPPPASHPSPAPALRPSNAAVLLDCRGAAAGFGATQVFSGVDLTVHAGETVAIVGRSGCGKTTLLHLLAGLLPVAAGTVDAAPAALMPQRDGLMPWASARSNAALPLRVSGMPRKEALLMADGQLEALGLADALHRRVGALSGGMRQRVALARTLLTGRELLLLDEPLAAVDALTRSELHALLLRHLATHGRGAVLVTHDLDEAVLLADRVMILGAGQNDRSGSALRPGPPLAGRPGERMEHRGGDALRTALLEGLAA